MDKNIESIRTLSDYFGLDFSKKFIIIEFEKCLFDLLKRQNYEERMALIRLMDSFFEKIKSIASVSNIKINTKKWKIIICPNQRKICNESMRDDIV